MATNNLVRLTAGLLLCLLMLGARAEPSVASINHGRFHDLQVFQPAGTPTAFVVFLSGQNGWTPPMAELARQLAQRGALVAGVDLPKFVADLETDGGQCVFPDGDLENLSHFVQAYYHLPTYLPPLLIGYGAGATLAYGVLVQSPQDTFSAALTLGFCPTYASRKPLCKGSGLETQPLPKPLAKPNKMDFLPARKLADPWVNLSVADGGACKNDTVRAFAAQIPGAASVVLPRVGTDPTAALQWSAALTAAFGRLTAQKPARQVAPPPAELGDLPVVEIPAKIGAPASSSFAIIMSGDGGWAGLDEDVAAALSARGIPVVGLDSLRYYWTKRTPEGIAADTDKIIRYYLAHLGKSRVMLIGYSQGADVLPFAVNRLPPETRASVSLAAVMGMSEHALFEFHLTSWVHDDDSGPETMPEMNRITGMPVLCIYGADETDSLCPKLDPARVRIVKMKGGHHFDGDYAGLAQQILSAAKP